MSEIEVLKRKICDYIDNCKTLSRSSLIKFIESLPPGDFVTKSKYKIMIKVRESERENFIRFLISCGFGDESGFWSCAKEENGWFIFDPSSSVICEFVVKDGLLRRYGIVLDDVTLGEDNIKRIELHEKTTAQYKVTIAFESAIKGEIKSKSTSSATFEFRSMNKDRSPYDILGIGKNNVIVDIRRVRDDVPVVTGVREESCNYSVSYPLHLQASIIVTSEDSNTYTLARKAYEILCSEIKSRDIEMYGKFILKDIENA